MGNPCAKDNKIYDTLSQAKVQIFDCGDGCD